MAKIFIKIKIKNDGDGMYCCGQEFERGIEILECDIRREYYLNSNS